MEGLRNAAVSVNLHQFRILFPNSNKRESPAKENQENKKGMGILALP